MTNALDLLDQAAKTMRERSVERDVKAERSMARAVKIFNAQFGTNMTEYQGWMFMVHLKLSRAEGGRFREDDYLDAAAYIALAGECRGNEPDRINAPVGSEDWEQLFQEKHGRKPQSHDIVIAKGEPIE